MLDYITSPTSNSKDPKAVADPKRVKWVHSNMLADPSDRAGIIAEFQASAGRNFDCIAVRDSFYEGEHLTEEQFQRYVERLAHEYLYDRPFIAVLHGDTDNDHFHLLAPVLDDKGRCLNFKGKGAHREAVRRMDIIDRLSEDFGLKVTPREPGRYNSAQNREGIEAVRMRQAGKPRWIDELKQRINEAKSRARTAEEFVSLCGLQKVGVRFRGQGISYDYKFNGRKYTVRGKRLGTDYTREGMPFKVGTGGGNPPPGTPPPHDMTPITTGRGSRGRSGAGVASGGRISIDKRGMDEVSRAQAQASEASANEALQNQAQAVRELADQLSKGR